MISLALGVLGEGTLLLHSLDNPSDPVRDGKPASPDLCRVLVHTGSVARSRSFLFYGHRSKLAVDNPEFFPIAKV